MSSNHSSVTLYFYAWNGSNVYSANIMLTIHAHIGYPQAVKFSHLHQKMMEFCGFLLRSCCQNCLLLIYRLLDRIYVHNCDSYLDISWSHHEKYHKSCNRMYTPGLNAAAAAIFVAVVRIPCIRDWVGVYPLPRVRLWCTLKVFI